MKAIKIQIRVVPKEAIYQVYQSIRRKKKKKKKWGVLQVCVVAYPDEVVNHRMTIKCSRIIELITHSPDIGQQANAIHQ